MRMRALAGGARLNGGKRTSVNRRHQLLGSICLVALPTLALAAPEGTRQLGLTQGLEGNSVVQVFANQGETIRVCSSDNGTQEVDVVVDGVAIRLDANPGQPNAGGPMGDTGIPANRRGSEILISPPVDTLCANDAGCMGALRCRSLQDGSAYNGAQRVGVCARPIPVTANSGYCNAGQPDNQRRWITQVADVAGNWKINFVGEPETITQSGRSTRFFEVDVQQANGQPAPLGRLNTQFWRINAHSFNAAYSTDTTFFAVANVGNGARVFAIDFENLNGFRFGVLGNTLGITGHARQSWCLFGNPGAGRRCPANGDANTPVNTRQLRYNIYLNYPDPAPAGAPDPQLGDIRFNDEVGTRSISPNGDGQQDSGAFSFTSNTNATYEIIIDTDRNGRLDALSDRTLRGDAVQGRNEARWDGADRNGAAVPPGQYLFDIRLATAETHFPMDDIENNSDGFVVYEHSGPNQRTPVRMFWDDTAIRIDDELIDLQDVLSSLPNGSLIEPVVQRRRWTQPRNAAGDDIPLIMDTWVRGAETSADRATCETCEGMLFNTVIVDPVDEAFDSDGDGLPDGIEDSNGNGMVDPGETDPNDPDTDDDGILDGVEDANHNGNFDQGETDPTDADTDNDGLNDGAEDANQNGSVDAGETDPRDPDTDDDGLNDRAEVEGPTNPLDPDSDDDGLLDGQEDRNGNGRLDADETDPTDPDSDDDGLTDGTEVNGQNPTNPRNPDSDRDGLTDGQEDANRDGAFQQGVETNPNDADTDDGGESDGSEVRGGRNPVDNPADDMVDPTDTDNDGLTDQEEDINGNGVVDPGETDPNNPDTDGDGVNDGPEVRGTNPTNPTNPDTDGDGLPDGIEDANGNGGIDPGETNPNDSDTDDDGLSDGDEDENANGMVDMGETDPRNPDTDADGLTDGTEVNGQNPTNPLDFDSDDDGLPDGDEDANQDGAFAQGEETDPNNPDTDGGGEADGSEVQGGRNPVDNPDDDIRGDRDGDGIDDLTEVRTGTDPDDPDTDDDGSSDGEEDRNFNGVVDPGETDPRDPDFDDDGILDGNEDRNHNGEIDAGESDPRLADTDGDGLPDGLEDANRDGVRDPGETDPSLADTDGDRIPDGIEDANRDGSWLDPGSLDDPHQGETDPTNPDTDGDGLADGVEDANQNGIWEPDAGETDPRTADTDGDGLNDDVDPDPLDGLGEDTAPERVVSGASLGDCTAAPGSSSSPLAFLGLLVVAGALRRRRR